MRQPLFFCQLRALSNLTTVAPSPFEKNPHSLRTVTADINQAPAPHDGVPERGVLPAIPYIPECLVIEIPHHMTRILVITTGHHIAVGCDDCGGPHPQTPPRRSGGRLPDSA